MNKRIIHYIEYKNLTSSTGIPWHTETSTDTQYRFTFEEDTRTLYIDFQSARSTKDWIMAFFFWKREASFYPIRIHAGFLKKYESIRSAIRKEIYERLPKEIILRGYSKGGTMASMAYLDICKLNKTFEYPFKLQAYVYGNPRIYERKISKERPFTYLDRIKNRGDIVTNLPPWLFNYTHVGQEYLIGDGKLPLPKHHNDKLYLKNLEKEAYRGKN